jgi:DNA-binding HxlR family transcriptional regulator
MIHQLDEFLDQLAEGHRERMEEVVTWINENASLDQEIARSVTILNPLLHRWSLEICFVLRMREIQRFTQLQNALGNIGSKTLSSRLKDLVAQGFVERKVYPEVPIRVEYSLSQKGLRMADLFLPVIAHLRISRLKEEGRMPEDPEQPGTTPAASDHDADQ